ncbi:Pkinase-domain-containing protein [Coemansia reversa NRRL 1564]|uniref:Serine/threonine-protein kinase n=1 Tax=Coemansia reversa (strain ATCC 12441 / NRRL 1564) TaxID=763665 RepID=A0A2G5B666_COERN|nr:Pkinase-domain-containing protein [Coemansia reversa NRRL 1564]|eukprot:PIA14491.1 Pkinase-domain-containing protein [Coemansia reversa NRRL 1564]
MAVATATKAFKIPVDLPSRQLSNNSSVFTCTDGVSVPAVFIDRKGGGQGYRVVSLLGRGAFGRCYEVRVDNCPELPNWACKTIEKSSMNSRKVVERVKYEMKVMKRLPRHKNVVAFNHIFEDIERLYILMEMCTSRTLHDLLQRRKRLTEFESRYFFAQLADGIAALHKANIIHRDIKHSNLLLDEMNRIKIADFGLSTIVDAAGDRKLSFLGTPNFLAPELVTRDGQGHSFGVDVWAAGVLLYVMLYGRPPFSINRANGNTNLQQLYHRIVDQQIVFPTEPYTSQSVQDLINRLCCKGELKRLSAADICGDAWFLIHADSSVPKFMPNSVFDVPIRNLHEYRRATAGMGVIEPQQQEKQLAAVVPVKKIAELAKGNEHKPVRRPLEPIPENEVRILPSRNPLNRPSVKTRGQTGARADEAGKENQQLGVDQQLERMRLADRKTCSSQPQAYGLRPRTSKPDSSHQVHQANERSNVISKSEAETAERCQVQAEFGRVTKLSEGYIPSILRWKERLQMFCAQTEQYLRRSSSELEAELYASAPDKTVEVERENDYPRVGMYLLNWMALTKYGLGFRLSDGTTGTLFNDNTSLLRIHEPESYVYVRPYENRSSIGHYSASDFPPQLDKKQRLLHSFGHKIAKSFSARVDRDICADNREPGIVKCLLQALATNVGMVFLLTGNVLQFNMRNHSKLFLYKDAHIFYKNPDGGKWHFDLRQGPEMLIRNATIDIEQFLLCLGYAQKVLATWNLPFHAKTQAAK